MARPLGVTTLQILASIRDGTNYGLEIVAATDLPSGTVYPALGRLARKGLVESEWEEQTVADDAGRPRRRYYRLTAEGRDRLAAGLSRLADMSRQLAADPVPEAR